MGSHLWYCCRCNSPITPAAVSEMWYSTTRGDVGIGKVKGISPHLPNNYWDDVFTLKDMLGLKKNIPKDLL